MLRLFDSGSGAGMTVCKHSSWRAGGYFLADASTPKFLCAQVICVTQAVRSPFDVPQDERGMFGWDERGMFGWSERLSPRVFGPMSVSRCHSSLVDRRAEQPIHDMGGAGRRQHRGGA